MVRFGKAYLGCALALTTHEVGAAEQVQVALQFHSPPGCSDRETFATGLRNRSKRIQIVVPAERGLIVSVKITPGEQLVHGELRLTDDDKETELRAVDGADCAEVVEALSLTAALAIERTVASEAEVQSMRTHAAAPPEPPPRAISPPESRSDVDANSTRWSSASDPVSHASELLVVAAASERITSQTSIGVSLGFLKRLDLTKAFRPHIGIVGIYVPSEFVQPKYRLRVSYVGANLQACPVVTSPISGLTLAPCAVMEVGVLSVKDGTVDIASPSSRPLMSLGGLGRANLAITRHTALVFELGLFGSVPTRSYSSELPSVQVGRAAPILWEAGTGWLFGW